MNVAKLLLVEDDNNLREIYEARLSAEGYDISTAQNGEEALSIAKQLRPDLIISDVMMPRISGFEMLDILRNTDELKNTKIIMLTALGQAEDRGRADNLGADKYLVKSQVTLEDIVQTAHELLEGTAEPAPEVTAAAAPVAPVVPTAPAVDVTPEVQAAPAVEPLVAAEPVTVSPVPPVPVAPEPAVVEPPVAPEPALPMAEPTTVDTTVPEPITVTPSVPVPADNATASDDIVVPAPSVEASATPVETVVTPPMPVPEAPVVESVTPVATPATPSTSPTPEPVAPEAEQAANDAVLEAAINNLTATPAVATPAPVAPAVAITEPAPAAPVPEAPAEPSSTEITGRKVITPITDPSAGPDINALLAQAEAEEAVPVTAAPAPLGTIAPSADVAAPQAPAPAAAPTNGVDPNSIAL